MTKEFNISLHSFPLFSSSPAQREGGTTERRSRRERRPERSVSGPTFLFPSRRLLASYPHPPAGGSVPSHPTYGGDERSENPTDVGKRGPT